MPSWAPPTLSPCRPQVGVLDAFKPAYSFEAPGKGKSQWKQRLVAGLALCGTFYLLYAHSPDVDQLKEEALKAHESLLDYLVSRAVHEGAVHEGAVHEGAVHGGSFLPKVSVLLELCGTCGDTRKLL